MTCDASQWIGWDKPNISTSGTIHTFVSLAEFSQPGYKNSGSGGGMHSRSGFLQSIMVGYNEMRKKDEKVRQPSSMNLTVKEFSFYETAVRMTMPIICNNEGCSGTCTWVWT